MARPRSGSVEQLGAWKHRDGIGDLALARMTRPRPYLTTGLPWATSTTLWTPRRRRPLDAPLPLCGHAVDDFPATPEQAAEIQASSLTAPDSSISQCSVLSLPPTPSGAVADRAAGGGYALECRASRTTPVASDTGNPSISLARSCTRSPTSGSATAPRCGPGPTSGSTRMGELESVVLERADPGRRRTRRALRRGVREHPG